MQLLGRRFTSTSAVCADYAPPFPELDGVAIEKIVTFANGFCPDGGDDD
jgi:hypothetical protein